MTFSPSRGARRPASASSLAVLGCSAIHSITLAESPRDGLLAATAKSRADIRSGRELAKRNQPSAAWTPLRER